MANKHILSLEVQPVANCEILSIRDTSQYTDDLAIDCPELLITTPGFNSPTLIKVQPYFDLNLSSCALALQTEQCGTTRTHIPDGVYIIRYSVSPNDKAYVEYNHLRVTTLLSSYYSKLCEIDALQCEPDRSKREIVLEMNYIKTLIDAAVAKVEYCQSPSAGMDIYNFAKKKLEKITCSTASCC